ncbi:hypothetical protein DB88DRAFT_225126 [Papiliotrema laurentii]|uniref:Uncharacterized protein n=1 Tax=Papiliotrema laurentii TaxID=5418 RepID=A0AAD9L606_PAPLA|nr:hypothetical protein DB88DRAFT_225126 [Papiliotrema laurentii]
MPLLSHPRPSHSPVPLPTGVSAAPTPSGVNSSKRQATPPNKDLSESPSTSPPGSPELPPKPISPNVPAEAQASLIRPARRPTVVRNISIAPVQPPEIVRPSETYIDALPRTLRDLQSWGESTAHPPPFLLNPTADRASMTIRPGSMVRHLQEYQAVLENMEQSTIGTTTIRPESTPYDPVALMSRGQRAVDELDVEWCWFCRRDHPRQEMVLRELGKDGRQWVCKPCVEQREGGDIQHELRDRERGDEEAEADVHSTDTAISASPKG